MGYMQVQSVCERISCMCMPARRRALLVEPSAPPPNIALLALEDNQSNAKALEPTKSVIIPCMWFQFWDFLKHFLYLCVVKMYVVRLPRTMSMSVRAVRRTRSTAVACALFSGSASVAPARGSDACVSTS